MSNVKVAPHRMILENPAAPGTGIIVAAGDEIPAYAAGYVENTPNKVDAARNFDVADAADQAKNPRPAERVISRTGNDEELRVIHERVAANRAEFDEELQRQNDPQGWLPREKFDGVATRTPTDRETAPTKAGEPDETTGPALGDLTVKQLDQLADDLGDGKPEEYGGNKADKVAALEGKVTQAQINAAAE